ncbi:MAG: RluA family pseudouridine synthase [Proteobacteria bacterium]|uniref:Pseudouridine synthase n=1 Tax=SAR86 cluster bacterium TaxID=2030880 RepID=A0A937I905_9GAMM|nr:RluA family pseudouridine synthase [SAR86 cluster bacterium]MDA0344675.1 RluA family pseudouridine synthase [Pseudomonadota bacterium]
MISKTFEINEDNINNRLDIFLANQFDNLSRGIVQKLIESHSVSVSGNYVEKDYKLRLGDIIDVEINLISQTEDQPQDIPLNVIFENKEFFIIDKQAGLTVHPGAGQKDNTLINGLLFHFPAQRRIPRTGLIHRLDKDTSGLILIAKTLKAHTKLTDMIQKRLITRKYLALVHGKPISGSTIDKPIGRHPTNRLIFTVKKNGRNSVTHYLVKERYKNFSLLDVSLETGRTHQIRVHLKHAGYPIAGDKAYCSITKWKDSNEKEAHAIQGLRRQALHAYSLAFTLDGEEFNFHSDIPIDIKQCINSLQK